MRLLGGILALLIGIAGWYYLFYSRAAQRLGLIEPAGVNRRRQQLRHTNGGVMVILAVLLYAGFYTSSSQEFMLVWLGVCILLAVVVFLGIIDIWLTARLRRKK